MKNKVGDKTQIYCVVKEWVDGNENEIMVLACFLDKKDAIAFMEDAWEEEMEFDDCDVDFRKDKYNMFEFTENMKEGWKKNKKREKHHLCLFIDTVILK